MTTNPSPPQGSEEFDCDEIERELKEISAWPWRLGEWTDNSRSIESANPNKVSLMCDAQFYPWCPDNDSDWIFISKSPERLAAAVKRVRELEEEIKNAERSALQRCWENINSTIIRGSLEGNGLDETATNNGRIEAANIIMRIMQKK